MKKKNIIFLVGFMGSGKTTLGKALAVKLNLKFLDTDERIIQLENQPIDEIFNKNGEDYFRSLESEVLKEICFNNESRVISTGGGFPCFNDNMTKMLNSGFVVYISADPTTLYNRLENDSKRPLLKSNSNLREYIVDSLMKREPIYKRAHLILDASELPHSILNQISQGWKNY